MPLFVQEIFKSFQGEGLLVGVPQVFLRLSGCNLECGYCDTPQARERGERGIFEDGRGGQEPIANPAGISEVIRLVSSLWYPGCHSVSVTGGEPLLQASELAELLPELKSKGMDVYLESNGTLHEELALLLPWTDWIAMDVKLPSSQGGKDLIGQHLRFLRLARQVRTFLKMVVDKGTGDEELAEACSRLGEEAGDMALVLQPATPPEGEEAVSPRRVEELFRIASASFREVRVIPQMHRAWGAG